MRKGTGATGRGLVRDTDFRFQGPPDQPTSSCHAWSLCQPCPGSPVAFYPLQSHTPLPSLHALEGSRTPTLSAENLISFA